MDEGFELLRRERRIFFCPNKLWYELKKQTKDCVSISQYIKMAVVEKMKRENPEGDKYYEELLICNFPLFRER